MDASLRSFEEDLCAGFDLLHIDTSREGATLASPVDAVRRLVRLYEDVVQIAGQQRRRIGFELGFEDAGKDVSQPTVFAEQARGVIDRLRSLKLPLPAFLVASTGTLVVGATNVGVLVKGPHPGGAFEDLNKIAGVCNALGPKLKAHNCDYLPSSVVKQLRMAGVHALNVAPELGVVETRALVSVLESSGAAKLAERFLAYSFDSLAWKKWVPIGLVIPDREKAILAGHYIFSTTSGIEIRDQVRRLCERRGENLDEFLQSEIERIVDRYLVSMSASSR